MRTASRGLTIAESLVAMGLVAVVMGALALLFQRSFGVLRQLDDKERVRQVSRMGLDRILSEVREATRIVSAGTDIVQFEKIDPSASAVPPIPAPPPPPAAPEPADDYTPPSYLPEEAYPDSSRLIVTYRIQGEVLVRQVQRKTGGASQSQAVVEGVNSFVATVDDATPNKVTVAVSAKEKTRVTSLKGSVLCPCIVVDPS